MKPYYQDDWVSIVHGDCREVLPSLNSASAIVTDPPYELGFMGKAWDSKGVSFQPETWQIIRNACLTGTPLLSFGGTRTFHRIACAIEDAGWEVRDTLMWVYGSGFPKSLDISKAIDRVKGVQPLAKIEASGVGFMTKAEGHGGRAYMRTDGGMNETKVRLIMPPATTPEAQLWEGYGTALKPAYEPIILAMNPLDGTFANNALKHRVAGLNIDGCRIGYADAEVDFTKRQRQQADCGEKGWTGNVAKVGSDIQMFKEKGRFPSNFIHDGSQLVMELFPRAKTGTLKRVNTSIGGSGIYSGGVAGLRNSVGSDGSAARFFYCAKAGKGERGDNNKHPTVKPLALMEYLVKLITMPEYNLVLDPFMGSGTTLLACIKLGIPCIEIDNDEATCEIAAKRCTQKIVELL